MLILQTCTARLASELMDMYKRDYQCKISTQCNKCRIVMTWELGHDITRDGTKGEKKNKEETVARHDKTASSIISQSEHINRREHTLCHALVSVRQSPDMQAVLLSLSLSLLPCKHRLFLIFQFLGLHDNKIIPCRGTLIGE